MNADQENSCSWHPGPIKIRVPRNIGRLTVIKQIGRGGMGVVLQAWDPFIERYVALKIPLPSGALTDLPEGAYNKEFFREAQTAGSLTHPNIVSIYDADICNDFCYLAMEYIDGTTLNAYSQKGRLLPVAQVLNIVFNTCRGLDYAHNRGVVHWDIKPVNIMLTRAGAVKITDFSIARMKHDALKTMVAEAGFSCSGTISYMSPQSFSNASKVDPRSDIFSLGCVLYELLTGEKTFSCDNVYTTMYKIANEDPPPVSTLRPDLPEILDGIVGKAIMKDPDERYQSCMDFAYDLGVALRHLKRKGAKKSSGNLTDYIRNITFFESFSRAQISQILKASNVFRASKGTTIVAEGEIDDTLFIILSGTVEVLKGDLRLDTIDRGECFGELAYLSGQPRAATIKALTDCIVIKISAALMDRQPESTQILFLKSFAKTAVDRIFCNHQLILKLAEKAKRAGR